MLAQLNLLDLTNTAVAPLQQDFIQLAEPLCSSVDIRVAEQTTCEVDVQFSGVPTAKLEEIKPRCVLNPMSTHYCADGCNERICLQIFRQDRN